MKQNGLVVLAAGALLIGAPACSRPAQPGAAGTPTGRPSKTDGQSAAPQERYAITGEIVRLEPERQVLVVRHDEVPGYMPAMTMEFLVSAGELARAKPGQRIRAEMIPSQGGDFRLEKIWPDERTVEGRTVAAAALQLRTPAASRPTAKSENPCRNSRFTIKTAGWCRVRDFAAGKSCSISSSPAAPSRRCARRPRPRWSPSNTSRGRLACPTSN
ncbi:MAG: copper-binding protein [Verrucomicrobia bacterium]|nr:copper-binding protein [Verrucomicrobiota bacterium]